MINAGWFGETEIVKFLIKNGANKGYKNQNDFIKYGKYDLRRKG